MNGKDESRRIRGTFKGTFDAEEVAVELVCAACSSPCRPGLRTACGSGAVSGDDGDGWREKKHENAESVARVLTTFHVANGASWRVALDHARQGVCLEHWPMFRRVMAKNELQLSLSAQDAF